MKRNLVIKESKCMFSIFIVFILFLSCKNNNSTLFECKNTETYEIIYNEESIVFKKKFVDNSVVQDTLTLENGEYFDVNNKNCPYLSVKKDTSYFISVEDDLYQVEIRKIDNNLFETADYYIYIEEGNNRKIHLVSHFYDENYKIVKIQKNLTVEFVPK